MAEEKVRQIKLSNITVDESINPRAGGLNPAHVADLEEAIEAGDELPPLVLYQNAANTLLLSEGFHRAEAYRRKGVKAVPAVIRKGERKDALANACGSNRGHGLKRTNADKRRAVELLLAEFSAWSNPRIAESAGVSVEFVRKIRPAEDGEQRVGADGKSRTATPHTPEQSSNNQPATVAGCERENPDESAESSVVATPDSGPESEPDEADSGEPEPDGEADSAPPPATVKPPTQVDGWGIPVQPHAAAAFAAGAKFKELAAAIQHAQKLFNELACAEGGQFLRQADVSSFRRGKKTGDGEYEDKFVHEGLERAYRQVKAAAPAHTVCPYRYADAPHPDDCRCCLGLNWTPELSRNIPPVCVERAKAAFGVESKEAA